MNTTGGGTMGGVKAADISDEQFMAALDPDGWPTMTWELVERLGYPEKVVRAKARTMIERRKTVDGCYCGCRGDFENIAAREARWARPGAGAEGLARIQSAWEAARAAFASYPSS